MEGAHQEPRYPFRIDGLVGAAVIACVAALIGRELGLLGAAAVVVSLAFASRVMRLRVWICAVPAALGAVEIQDAPPRLGREGPTCFDARVLTAERDLRERVVRVRLVRDGARATGIVHGLAEILPGDRMHGIARVVGSDDADAGGWLETREGCIRIERPSVPPWDAVVTRLRNALESRLLGRIPGPDGALLCHLVLGHGPRLDDEVVAAHRATGLAHLLAVSGAHASMLAWMIGIAFRWLTAREPWRARGFRWFCAGFLAVYGGITGWDAPMFRAFVAFAILLATHAAGRRPSIVPALAGPALLTALVRPDDLGSASFCLSYAAVLGLGMSGTFDDGTLWRGRATAPLRASFWAALATAPWTLLYFGQVAPWTVLATPVLAPCVGFMLGGGLVLSALGDVPVVTATLTWGVEVCTGLYRACVVECATWPGAPILAPTAPPPGLLVGLALAGLALVLARPTRRTFAVAVTLSCVPHFLSLPSSPPPRLQLLAVGHGQAALLTADSGERVLLDCGSLGNAVRPARQVARALGTDRFLDVLILSHGDFDHCGAVAELLRRVQVRSVVLPETMRGHPVVRALAGRDLRWIPVGDTLEVVPGITAWAPGHSGDVDENERSLWVRAVLGGLRVVLPADAGAVSIRTETPLDDPADVLVLPHHGRGDPSALAVLLDRLRPQLCLVSNRRREGETELARCARERGYPTLQTGDRGTIVLTADARPQVVCERPRRIAPVSSASRGD